MKIWTVGHSTRTIAELAAVVKAHGVEQIIDIRTIRRSRANPQFNEAVIARALAKKGVRYRVDEKLGGRRGKAKKPPALPNDAWESSAFKNYADYAETAEFREGLRELIAEAKKRPSAIMCAEAVWWRCHRRIVADWLIARKVEVLHIMSERDARPAELTPFAKIVRGRVHYPK